MKKTLGIRSTTSTEQPPISAKYDLVLRGSPLDDRGRAAREFSEKAASKWCDLKFHTETRQFALDGTTITANQLEGLVNGARMLIEATTLGVAEICGILRSAIRSKVKHLDFLYVEPQDYTRSAGYGISGLRSFKLSENRTFVGIPGYSIDTAQYSTGNAVFFLGYEGERLSQAIEQMGLDDWRKTAVFGVPAFKAGWETNAFANNITFLKNYQFSESRYAAASSVQAAFTLLSDLHVGHDNPDMPTVIAPLGTKPHSIGCALFVAFNSAHNSAGLVFDHPVKSQDRSEGMNRWHVINVDLESVDSQRLASPRDLSL